MIVVPDPVCVDPVYVAPDLKPDTITTTLLARGMVGEQFTQGRHRISGTGCASE